MKDYVAIALAWIVRLGFTDWTDGYVWYMGGVLPMVSDGSGWPKGWPDPYWFFTTISNSASNDTAATLIADTSQDSNSYASWADLFARYCGDRGNTSDPTLASCPPQWDGVSIVQTQSSAGYFLWRQGSLHLAVGLGVPGAAAASAWLDGQIPAQIAKYKSTNDPRFSFAIDTSRTTLSPPGNVHIIP
jgi:hypothetical protein